jgi:hypothetical protein
MEIAPIGYFRRKPMHAWLADPSFWRSVAIGCGVIAVATVVWGIVVRLREMPRSRFMIRLKVGSRVVYYDPDNRAESEAQIYRALHEGIDGGTGTH